MIKVCYKKWNPYWKTNLNKKAHSISGNKSLKTALNKYRYNIIL